MVLILKQKNVLPVPVDNREAATLLPIIEEYVLPGNANILQKLLKTIYFSGIRYNNSF